MAAIYSFGQMPFGPFPFSDCDAEKNRRVMVLLDEDDKVVVAYCTTNPTYEHTVSLGKCDDKVSNLVAWRWEVVQKERFMANRGIASPSRWSKEMIDMVALCAKSGLYKGYGPRILAECRRQRDFLLAKATKKATKR